MRDEAVSKKHVSLSIVGAYIRSEGTRFPRESCGVRGLLVWFSGAFGLGLLVFVWSS